MNARRCAAAQLIRTGRLNGMAVTTPERLAELPQMPTMAEAGYGGIGTSAWQGIFVPEGTPRAIVQKLHGALARAVADKELQASFAKPMIVPMTSPSPEQFAGFVKEESARWGKLVKELAIKVDH